MRVSRAATFAHEKRDRSSTELWVWQPCWLLSKNQPQSANNNEPIDSY